MNEVNKSIATDADRELANSILVAYLNGQKQGWHKSIEVIASLREKIVRETLEQIRVRLGNTMNADGHFILATEIRTLGGSDGK